jgi:hypothetical protein
MIQGPLKWRSTIRIGGIEWGEPNFVKTIGKNWGFFEILFA